MRIFFFLIIVVIFFAGCGRPHDPQNDTDFSQVMPEYLRIAESLTSTLTNQYGMISGAPTPGALLGKGCSQSICLTEGDIQTQALFRKSTLKCHTKEGSLDGTLYMRVNNVPEFEGCATRSGPFVFKSWPPNRGSVTFSIGTQDFFTSEVKSSAPTKVFERIENNKLARHWGTATLAFSGSENAKLTFDHWTEANGGNKFHFQTENPINWHMDSTWDSSDRTLTGSFTMLNHARGLMNHLALNNIRYRKERCCHPIAGNLVISSDATPNPDDGAASFFLRFTDICGQALLLDGLGHESPVTLPECAS